MHAENPVGFCGCLRMRIPDKPSSDGKEMEDLCTRQATAGSAFTALTIIRDWYGNRGTE